MSKGKRYDSHSSQSHSAVFASVQFSFRCVDTSATKNFLLGPLASMALYLHSIYVATDS